MNTTPRPMGLTPEQLDQFYREAAQEFIDNGWVPDDEDLDDIISDLKRVCLLDSGYEIAKQLERNSFVCYEIDSECISYLDLLDSDKDEFLTENIKQWVKDTNPAPVYKVGDVVTVISNINRLLPASTQATIHEVRKETAEYLVFVEGESGFPILPYEVLEANSIKLKEAPICGNCDSFCECGLVGKKMDDEACDTFDDSYYQFKKNQES